VSVSAQPPLEMLTPPALPPVGSLIGGKRLSGDEALRVSDCFSQQLIVQVPAATREQVALAVRTARAALGRIPPPYERARILRRAAELIDARRANFIDLMVAEAGFTPSDAAGELERAIDTCQLCAEEAKRITGEMVALDGNAGQQHRLGFTLRTPVGVVCAITPFNAPLNSVIHKVGPALAAGNAVLLKPSEHTPLTASLVCEILLEAGLPPDLLALVNGDAAVGAWLLEEQGIDFYSFTGSTRVGRLIQAGAGLRRTQLELGSIACTVVCADADLDHALPRIARATFRKAGQVCTSIQRLYVERAAVAAVTERLRTEALALPAGNPSDAAMRIGPMITEAQARRAQGWINEAVDGKARVECGGDRDGLVLQATILSGVAPGMKVIDQEIFAPVVSILPFEALPEAIDSINATPFGLATGIFTNNLTRALAAARNIRSGGIHINETSSSRVDGMPYGGVKDSGFGREGPRYAIGEMMDEKMITLAAGGGALR